MSRQPGGPLTRPTAAGRPRGCLAFAIAAPALLALAPAVAAVRAWRAWRRGRDWRVEVERVDDGGDHACIDLRADIPRRSGATFPRRLTHALVRAAEAGRRADDVVHLLYRVPANDEATLVPVGPQLQELGERLQLALAQADLERRTALWLTLPSQRAIAELVDPTRDDPEAAGEPGALVARTGARRAMATSWARWGPSTVYRVLLWVPADGADSAEGILRSVGE